MDKKSYTVSWGLLIHISMIVSCFLLTSCSIQSDNDEEVLAVHETVRLYNDLMSEGYANMNMGALPEAASEKRTMKLYHHMAALGEGHSRMLLDLETLVFTKTSFPQANSARANTTEKWRYKLVEIETGKELFNDTIDYEIRYVLLKKEGRWLVDDIEIVKEEALKDPLSEVPFLQRPATKKKTARKVGE